MSFEDDPNPTPPTGRAEPTPTNLIRDIADARHRWTQSRLQQWECSHAADSDSGRTRLEAREQELVDQWNADHPALLTLWRRSTETIRQETDHRGRLPLAGATWCLKSGPRYGSGGASFCTLPAGHRRNPDRRLGAAGCRFTFGDTILLDDTDGAETVLFAPGSVEPGPAVQAVRVLAERHWGDTRAHHHTWSDTRDGDTIYVRQRHASGWRAEFLDPAGVDIGSAHVVGSWQELTETRVLVDATTAMTR